MSVNFNAIWKRQFAPARLIYNVIFALNDLSPILHFQWNRLGNRIVRHIWIFPTSLDSSESSRRHANNQHVTHRDFVPKETNSIKHGFSRLTHPIIFRTFAMNDTSANHTTTSALQTTINLAVYFITFFVGLTGNLLVVVIIIRRKTRKRMNDFFVLNLSVSDLCLILFCLPALIYLELIGYVGSRFYCKFVWPMVTVSYCSSVYTITSMACYRCRVLLHPFELPPCKKTVLLWISTIWFLSFVVATPLIVASKFREDFHGSTCYEDWPSISFKRGYTVALFILQYLLPLLTITVAYIRIGIDLTRTKVRRASVTRRGEVSDQGVREENIKIIKVLLTIVILFAFCMLPVHLAWMSLDFGGKRGAEISDIIFKFSDVLAILHSCLNAVIYGALTKHLRHGFVKYLLRPLSICHEFRNDETRTTSQRRRTNELSAEEMETFPFGGKSSFSRKTAV